MDTKSVALALDLGASSGWMVAEKRFGRLSTNSAQSAVNVCRYGNRQPTLDPYWKIDYKDVDASLNETSWRSSFKGYFPADR